MRSLMFVAAVVGCVVCVLMQPRARAADPSAPAEITVTDRVVTRDVEPLGANLTTIAGGTNFAVNNHVWSSGFEPIVWRKMTRVERAGDNWFEWDSHGGPGDCAWYTIAPSLIIRRLSS